MLASDGESQIFVNESITEKRNKAISERTWKVNISATLV